MELLLDRNYRTELTTISDFYINSIFESNILEDKDRGLYNSMSLEKIKSIKQYGKTCIPYTDDNEYIIGWRISQRFSNQYFWSDLYKKLIPFKEYSLLTAVEKTNYSAHEMMWITNTKGFDFCYFHWGNTHLHTLGCLIIGKRKNNDFVENSRDAYIKMYQKIRPLKNIEPITLKISI